MRAIRAVSLLVAGAAWLTVSSCTDRGSPGPTGPQSGLIGGLAQNVGLLSCSPLAADSVTQTIGPAGGTLVIGPHVLVVPAGALAAPVAITAILPADTVNHVQLRPEGLAFQHPASLTLSYANCNLLGQLLPKRVAYTSDALVILDYLVSVDHLFDHTVTGQLEHFSNYAVAW